jgi:hypothetical protein
MNRPPSVPGGLEHGERSKVIEPAHRSGVRGVTWKSVSDSWVAERFDNAQKKRKVKSFSVRAYGFDGAKGNE